METLPAKPLLMSSAAVRTALLRKYTNIWYIYLNMSRQMNIGYGLAKSVSISIYQSFSGSPVVFICTLM